MSELSSSDEFISNLKFEISDLGRTRLIARSLQGDRAHDGAHCTGHCGEHCDRRRGSDGTLLVTRLRI